MADDIPSSQVCGYTVSARHNELMGGCEPARSVQVLHGFELTTNRWRSDGECSDDNRSCDIARIVDV